jgi:hypothetical protein
MLWSSTIERLLTLYKFFDRNILCHERDPEKFYKVKFCNLSSPTMSFLGRGGNVSASGVNPDKIEMAITEYVSRL